jgi:hypothetical protein
MVFRGLWFCAFYGLGRFMVLRGIVSLSLRLIGSYEFGCVASTV